jgi:cytidylate kinase
MALITMSREPGSGGNELARRICKNLSYRLFERNMMNEIASELGLDADETRGIGENLGDSSIFTKFIDPGYHVTKTGSWIDDDYGVWADIKKKIGDLKSVQLQADIIKAASKKGNMVIVGRGSQAILKDVPGVFHVRIIAPPEKRAEHTAKECGLEIGEARKKVAERDKASFEYVKKNYHIDPRDPMHYHLIVNTGQLSLEDAEKAIVAMV